MRVPLPWLREYCDPRARRRVQIEERLTMTGTKVEAIHHHGVPSTDGFVVGRVLSAEQHPDADRLKVCTVDVGASGEDGEAAGHDRLRRAQRRRRADRRGGASRGGDARRHEAASRQSSAASSPKG